MRIGIFADLLSEPMSGMGRYVYENVRQFSRTPDVELVALQRLPLRFGQEYFSETIRLPTHHHKFADITEILFLPSIAQRIKVAQLDVLHHPAQSPPIYFWFLPGKKLITIHGAAEFELPKELRSRRPIWRGFWQHTIQYKLFASSIEGFVTPSADAKRNIVKHYRLPEDKLHVIPHGIDHESFYPVSKPDAKAFVLRKCGISGEYILHISNYQPMKNLPNQLRAFAQFKNEVRDDIRFIIAGGRYYGFEEVADLIESLGIGDSVRVLSHVEGEELRMLYAGAKVFMFASVYESFGLPILEAMACGSSVITSNRYSMPEVAGDAALLVDPGDVDEIAAAMMKLHEDQGLYSTLRERGIQRAQSYIWELSASEHLELYQRITGRSAVVS